ncbi:MAG: alkaline phosphatase D family protein [Bacteroidota bacterium]
MIRFLLLLSYFAFGIFISTAQFITHGPVIGALTSSSAKIYIRTMQCGKVMIELSTQEDLEKSFAVSGITDSMRDKTVMLRLTSLKPDTRYYYRLLFEGWEDAIKGNFKTFPTEGTKGDYTFVTGSCQETKNMKVFEVIPKHHPYFLMHTGDFTYPDYQICPWYSNNYDTVAFSYQRRYDEKLMKQMLYNIPIDYVYDDNDYVGSNGGRFCKNELRSFIQQRKICYEFPAPRFPDSWRRNVIKGYDEFFPHYDLPDTSEGIFHSFKLGNAEFFVVDRNSAKDLPNADAFKYDSIKRKWIFAPPPGYALFGKKQMAWLKKSLLDSKADWKFIVSGVPLNGACRKLITAGVKIQNLRYKNWFGFHIASGFSSYWAGYPEEREDFMRFVKVNNIKNLIVISGDTHHNVMDDGTNAGLPELNASGMSVETTALARYLKLIGNLTGLYRMNKIWNKGGNGLKGKDSKNAFGKVRVVKDEFVELSIVDENNEIVSAFKVPFHK